MDPRCAFRSSSASCVSVSKWNRCLRFVVDVCERRADFVQRLLVGVALADAGLETVVELWGHQNG